MAYVFNECLDAACDVTVGDMDLDFRAITPPRDGGVVPIPLPRRPLPALPAGWRWAVFKTLRDQYLVTPAVDVVTAEVRRAFPGAQFTTLFDHGGGYARVFTSSQPGMTVLPRSERMPQPLYVAYETKPRIGGPYIE